eukprot:TRINITY_DN9620_c0_g1_i1.p1 TRINITY_DN9620_c0_g1~~TRINITY_DN9620_c0_g1_i1.p1  ORF type:complete len:445 (+),score=63.26 TRINITY_DN9620_c0_g1_i1:219-1553(+)
MLWLIFIFLSIHGVQQAFIVPNGPLFAAWMIVVEPQTSINQVQTILDQSIQLRQREQHHGLVWLVSSYAQQIEIWQALGSTLDAYGIDVRITSQTRAEITTDGLSFEDYDKFIVVSASSTFRLVPAAIFNQPAGCAHEQLLVLSNTPKALAVLYAACNRNHATNSCLIDLKKAHQLRARHFPRAVSCAPGLDLTAAQPLPSLPQPLWTKNATVFFHVPKTGGTSIEATLDKCPSSNSYLAAHPVGPHKIKCRASTVTARHHLPIYLLKPCGADAEYYHHKLTYAVIRQPLDRFLSSCQYMNPNGKEAYLNTMARRSVITAFEKVTQRSYAILQPIGYRGLHFMPQSWTIYDPSGRRIINYVAPIDHFANATRAFLKHVGCGNLTVMRENVSSQRGNMAHPFHENVYPLSKANRDAVLRVYERDIRLHEYFLRKYEAQRQLFGDA